MDSASQLIVFTFGIIAIIVLTARFRIQAFLALISVSIFMGLFLRISPNDLVKNVVDGFGDTLGYVGLLVFAATIIGELLGKTGATVVISESILRLVGRTRTAFAIGATGYLVTPPVACNDTAFLILSPVARVLGRASGYSTIFISLALAAGTYSSFKLVFPAAPLYAATIFQADLAAVIVLGFLISVPVFGIGLLWTRAYTHRSAFRSEQADPRAEKDSAFVHDRLTNIDLPSPIESYGIIVIPLILILSRALADAYLLASNTFRVLTDFIGYPVIAMLIGVGLSLFVARKHRTEEVSEWFGEGVARAASIVAIVGGGGVLGRILLTADLGRVLGSSITALGISGAVVVFLVAAVIKTAQGSSVVTMVTAPSILLPLLPTLGISPTLATLLVSAGAMISVHLNDSYFWVVTGSAQMGVSDGIKSLTAMSIIQGLTAFALVMLIRTLMPAL